MDIGKRIKLKCIEADMSLDELSKQVGLTMQTLSRYETGVIKNIPSDKIKGIAKVLNTTPGYWMG